MKLTTIAFFGLGYVLGSRAGRERYDELVEAAREGVRRFQERRADDTRTTSTAGNGSQFDWSEPLPRS